MTIADWLLDTTKKLGEAGLDAPRTDTLVLLEDVLGKDRAWVLANDNHKLAEKDLKAVNALILRRKKREPLAYIRTKSEFYGRVFTVTPEVLIPRPETESMIELALENINLKKAKILDIGTGSGIIGITIKLEKPNWVVTLSDVDDKALEIAKKNADNHKVEIEVTKSDLLSDITGSFDVIMANLPYVPDNLITSPEIEKEPSIAIFSGTDGMDHYKKFWEEVNKLPKKPKYILTESLESQHMIMAGLGQKAGYTLSKTQTLAQFYQKIS